MTRILTIIALLFATPAWADGNPDISSEIVGLMERLFLVFAIGSVLLVGLLKTRSSQYFLSALPLFALTLHQAEEYVLAPALLGKSYHFLNWAFEAGLYVSSSSVVWVNSVGIVSTLIIFAFRPAGKVFAFVFLFVSATLVANAAFHLGVATLQSSYSPGLITSLFLYIPLHLKGVSLVLERVQSFRIAVALTIYGFIAHFVVILFVNSL
tara:strand:- start:302 stop:931 length:630 start_codon:yes stop_codon:yes gene_type:complete